MLGIVENFIRIYSLKKSIRFTDMVAGKIYIKNLHYENRIHTFLMLVWKSTKGFLWEAKKKT